MIFCLGALGWGANEKLCMHVVLCVTYTVASLATVNVQCSQTLLHMKMTRNPTRQANSP